MYVCTVMHVYIFMFINVYVYNVCLYACMYVQYVYSRVYV